MFILGRGRFSLFCSSVSTGCSRRGFLSAALRKTARSSFLQAAAAGMEDKTFHRKLDLPLQNQDRSTHSSSQHQRSSSCLRFFCPEVCSQTREGGKSPPCWTLQCLTEHCSRFHLLPRLLTAFLVPANQQKLFFF